MANFRRASNIVRRGGIEYERQPADCRYYYVTRVNHLRWCVYATSKHGWRAVVEGESTLHVPSGFTVRADNLEQLAVILLSTGDMLQSPDPLRATP